MSLRSLTSCLTCLTLRQILRSFEASGRSWGGGWGSLVECSLGGSYATYVISSCIPATCLSPHLPYLPPALPCHTHTIPTTMPSYYPPSHHLISHLISSLLFSHSPFSSHSHLLYTTTMIWSFRQFSDGNCFRHFVLWLVDIVFVVSPSLPLSLPLEDFFIFVFVSLLPLPLKPSIPPETLNPMETACGWDWRMDGRQMD